MATATLIGVGNSAAVTIPKAFRTRNGLKRGDYVLIEEVAPTKIVVDVVPKENEGRKAALSRALEIAESLAAQTAAPFPSDGAALKGMLGDRDV